jgi:hypothetical protein
MFFFESCHVSIHSYYGRIQSTTRWHTPRTLRKQQADPTLYTEDFQQDGKKTNRPLKTSTHATSKHLQNPPTTETKILCHDAKIRSSILAVELLWTSKGIRRERRKHIPWGSCDLAWLCVMAWDCVTLSRCFLKQDSIKQLLKKKSLQCFLP